MPSFGPLDLLGAWLLDAALGDPRWLPWPHPVVLIGRLVGRWERRLCAATPGDPGSVLAGALLWAGTVAAALAAGAALLFGCAALHPALGRAAGIYLAYACLATRCLAEEAGSVARALEGDDLVLARGRLARIVGRDIARLGAPEVASAAVETVAENASDGVMAPLFYLALGALLGLGPLLGLAYKAVNTLDSMVGYRTPRHERVGKVSALADDLANALPARLTALLAAAAAAALWRRGRASLHAALRDGPLHASPNAGYPEAAFAGALGVCLGGTSCYGGARRPAAVMGYPAAPPEGRHIAAAVRLLWATSLFGMLVMAAGLTLL